MKAVTQSHPLTWCGAGIDCLKRHSELWGKCWLCTRVVFISLPLSSLAISLPSFSNGILLISMSRNPSLGDNFVQNSSELPREQGGATWWSCNLTLNNNGSPGCSGTCWQFGWLSWSTPLAGQLGVGSTVGFPTVSGWISFELQWEWEWGDWKRQCYWNDISQIAIQLKPDIINISRISIIIFLLLVVQLHWKYFFSSLKIL